MTQSPGSSSRLYAHHPEKKIIKKMMKNRPKKHRLSDINRRNVNLGKCITKIENAPSEYTLISAEGGPTFIFILRKLFTNSIP